MARGRTYSIRFAAVSVSALQDLLAVYCGANMAIELHGIILSQITATAVQQLGISVKRLPATVTVGSGGTAPIINKLERNDATASVTARANDTTQATSSGTIAILHSDVINLVNGYQFFWPPDDRPTAGLSEALIFTLDAAPASAVVMSGTLIFAERI